MLQPRAPRLTRGVRRHGMRLGAAVACVLVGLVGTVVPALAVAALLVAVPGALIGSEHTVARRRRSRGEPSPLQVLEGSPTTLADA